MNAPVAAPRAIRPQNLDGAYLSRLVMAGARYVLAHREELNRINVFPVADGDTGTNMGQTLRAVARSVADLCSDDLPAVARAAAEACIMGARGNSGLILSHFFAGLERSIGQRQTLTAAQVAGALAEAAATLCEAVDPAVEGTIITVARDATREAQRCGPRDLLELFQTLCAAAARSLAQTTVRLDVLQKAGVVDAGAKGFTLLLEGMERELQGLPMARASVGRSGLVARPHTSQESSAYRYCTEVVLRVRAGTEPSALRERVARMGDCVIPLVSGKLAHLHIHTDVPRAVLDALAMAGPVLKTKVEDMREQSRAFATAPTEGRVRLFTDSTADLPQELAESLGISVVPLHVRFGEEDLRDKQDILPDEFFHRLSQSKTHPTTSQPSPDEFLHMLRPIVPTLRDGEKALGILVSSKLSGTLQSAGLAARRMGDRVGVLDSGLCSAPLGLLVLRAAQWVRQGLSPDEVARRVEAARGSTNCLFMVDTLEYLHKGGRISWSSAFLGGLLGVRPILTFTEGRITPVARARGREAARAELLKLLGERVPTDRPIHFALAHTGRPDELTDVEDTLRKTYRVASMHLAPMGSVVGVHVGPGAWGVAWSVDEDEAAQQASPGEVRSEARRQS